MRRSASSVRDRILERARNENRPLDPSTVRIMKAIEKSISKIETYIAKASRKHDDNEAIFDAVFMDVVNNIPEKMLSQILWTQYIRELRGQSKAVSVISHYMNKAGYPVMSLDPAFKGMMRMPKRATNRTASEILNDLENRVARLESNKGW
jgi:hypothetical protein